VEKFSKNRTLLERITLHIWRSKFYLYLFRIEQEKIDNKIIKYIHLLIGLIIFVFVFFLKRNGEFNFKSQYIDDFKLVEFLPDEFRLGINGKLILNDFNLILYWLFLILFFFYWWRLRNSIYFLMNKFHKFL
jgi:hypothetical protein